MLYHHLYWATATITANAVVMSRSGTDLRKFDADPLAFNLTAINARDGRSVLECWQLSQRFSTNTQAGTIGALDLTLGGSADIHMSIIPAQFNGGLHNAPAPQLVLFTAGIAHITLPDSDDEAWIVGGRHGLIVAVDTADVSKQGHITEYPGMVPTIGFQMPMAHLSTDNITILHSGACAAEEMSAL